jgi:hypothetical protein
MEESSFHLPALVFVALDQTHKTRPHRNLKGQWVGGNASQLGGEVGVAAAGLEAPVRE